MDGDVVRAGKLASGTIGAGGFGAGDFDDANTAEGVKDGTHRAEVPAEKHGDKKSTHN